MENMENGNFEIIIQGFSFSISHLSFLSFHFQKDAKAKLLVVA